MPSPIPLHEVKGKLKRLGCDIFSTKAGHYRVERLVRGRVRVSGFPTVNGREVKACYRKQLQAQLGISRKDWDRA